MTLNRILVAFTIPLLCGLALSSRSHVRIHTFNHEQILDMAKQSWIAGFTTNPSLLKKAGVDLTTPEPVQATCELLDRLVTELEKLVAVNVKG